MSQPFAIFLPVRNGGDYISQAISSIVSQSDSEWRLIVLDNASTDNTLNTVLSFNDPRITIVKAHTSLDIVASWQRVYSWLDQHRKGNPLVTIIGHDDLLYPDFVARIKNLASDSPNATLYQTHFDLIGADGKILRPCRPIAEQESWEDLLAMIGWGLRDSFGTGYAFRAEDYLRIGGIPAHPRILYSDHLLFLRLTRLGYKRADPASACAFRLHVSSMSGELSVGRLDDWIEAFDMFLRAIQGEFGAFLATDRGRAAITSLLARELFVLDGFATRRIASEASRDRLEKFRCLMLDLGGSPDIAHWSYQAGRRLPGKMRRLKMQTAVARTWLRGRKAR